MSELRRCPFCSCELMPNTNQDDLYVKRYGTHWNHPDGPCFLAGTEVSPSQVDAWNQRFSTQGADARPVAIYLPCPICSGVEGCDHTVPERRRATSDAHTKLMKFYAVETTDALISAMEQHIEKLQSKLPQYRDPINQRVREG